MKKYLNDTLGYYDNNCDKYKDIWIDSFLNNYQFDVPDIFLSYLKDKSYILDLGCGTGRDSKYFLQKGYRVKAIDGSKEMCRLAEEYLKMDVEQINFLDIDFSNEFDGIFACCSLLHLNSEDLISCLNKISKALKENGVLYASFKYGTGERFVNGRYYNDMTEE